MARIENTLAPQWIVEDVDTSVSFYVEKLGFGIDWIGEKPLFAIISRKGIILMLRQLKKGGFARPNRVPFVKASWHTDAAFAWDAYVWVKNANKVYKKLRQ